MKGKREDIWDREISNIRLPPPEEIRRQFDEYGMGDGNILPLYLGKCVTAEDLYRRKAEVFGRLPPYGSLIEKLRYFLDYREFFLRKWGYRIGEAFEALRI